MRHLPVITRCTGNCCRCFTLNIPIETIREYVHRIRQRVPVGPLTREENETEMLADMLIPLGYLDHHPDAPAWFNEQKLRGHLYTCRHHDRASGDCLVYENRPSMCSRHPYGTACPYNGCTDPEARLPRPLKSNAAELYATPKRELMATLATGK